MDGKHLTARILAIDPCSKGFGFVVLETPDRLIDWGVACVWSHNDDAFLARLTSLIRTYAPTCLVLEQIAESPARRRTFRRLVKMRRAAEACAIPVMSVHRRTAYEHLGICNCTKHGIATSIAEAFVELRPWLPRRRRPWESEDARMHVFDATALALISLSALPTPRT